MNRPEFDKILVWRQVEAAFEGHPTFESKLYCDVFEPGVKGSENTVVRVVEKDCIEAAIQLKKDGLNPLLLNMADWEIAGGCVEYGSAAQEEELFRRSNYILHLHQKYYPLEETHALVSKGVEFHAAGARDGYILYEKPCTIDCVASPAVRFPRLTRPAANRFADEKDVRLMLWKIRQLFYIAQENGNDSLVLSAWGCGAFGCPAEHVAELFQAVVDEYKGSFKNITFAILGPNYAPFRSVLITSTR
jgi:uncharacterized protein (TIGR02452 family)